MKQLKHLRFLAVILLVIFVIILIVMLFTNPPKISFSSGMSIAGMIGGNMLP